MKTLAGIKNEFINVKSMKKVLELNEERLKINISKEQRNEIYQKMQTYKYFLVSIKSDCGKKFAYFVPTQFRETDDTVCI